MKKLVAIAWALILMAGCSSEPAKPAEPAKPKEPEAVTGRFAYQKLYLAAHGWARDAQGYKLESRQTADSTGKDGKATVWRASFASAVQRSVKPYMWSGSVGPDAPPSGISPGTEDTYNPNNTSTQVFDIQFLKIDSDKALAVAQEHGGSKIMDKAPATKIAYLLDWNHTTNQLVWHVMYGGETDTKLRVAVDGSSGEFIRVEK